MQIVAGVDLGGTAVNYTLVSGEEKFLIEGLCEHPALSKQGPDICLQQIEDGLKIVEGLLNTIYDLPAKAKGIQLRRSDAESAKAGKSKGDADTINWQL